MTPEEFQTYCAEHEIDEIIPSLSEIVFRFTDGSRVTAYYTIYDQMEYTLH